MIKENGTKRTELVLTYFSIDEILFVDILRIVYEISTITLKNSQMRKKSKKSLKIPNPVRPLKERAVQHSVVVLFSRLFYYTH